MLVTPHKSPLPFNPSDETPEANEDKVTEGFLETFRGIQETVLEDTGHAHRAVHAKSWGLVEGEMTVFEDLLPDYAQGIFRPGAVYPVVMRISSIPGDILDDSITVPHGLALKVFDVEGERLPGSEGDATQDFVMVNGPVFNTPNAKLFLANLKTLAMTTDKVEGLKKGVSAANRMLEGLIETFGGESRTLKAMGGAPMTHPLGDAFFSQTAFRYGDYVAKFSIAPASEDLLALNGRKEDVKGQPDGFRTLVADHLARFGGEWVVRVQLRTDRDMPIEDASEAWSQDESPYLPVASIRIRPQTGWSEARSKAVDDSLSFSVWHGVAAHQPLGAVNRCRKEAYAAAAAFRGAANGCPMHEPRGRISLPD